MKQGIDNKQKRSPDTPQKDVHFHHVGNSLPAGQGSAEDRVYRVLFDGILEHRLTPGMKLKEIPLAEAFGVTRGVIRKALSRLAGQKLVNVRANHGATVASPSLKEASEILAARRLVETALIETLTHTISDEQIKDLRQLVLAESDSYSEGDTRSGIWLSMSFHIRLGEYVGNTLMSEFLEQLVIQTPLIFLLDGNQHPGKSCSAREHTEIVDAIAAGDSKLAAARMEEHLQHVASGVRPQNSRRQSELSLLLGLD